VVDVAAETAIVGFEAFKRLTGTVSLDRA